MSESDQITPEMLRSADYLARRAAYRGWGDLDDLLSAAHWGIVRALRSHDASKASTLKTWVILCINSELASLRKQGRRRFATRGAPPVSLPGGMVQEREPGPAAAALYSDESDHFWGFITTGLSPIKREIVEMRYRHELTMRVIGERSGLSESRISQLLSGELHDHITRKAKEYFECHC